VLFVLGEFGTHEAGRAADLPQGLEGLAAKAEVYKFDLGFLVDDDVLWLYVTVSYIALMQIDQARCQLFDDLGRLSLSNLTPARQRLSFGVLHYQVHVMHSVNTLKQLDNVGVLYLLQSIDFSHNLAFALGISF
jgi:hypothetical protein